MGLEDRDWYRDEPSKSWRSRWDGPTDSRSGRAGWTGGGLRVRPGAWLAIAVSAVAVATTAKLDLLDIPVGGSQAVAARPATPSAAPVAPEPVPGATPAVQPSPSPAIPDRSKVVRLRSRPGFDVPAQTVARWSVTDRRFGTVSVVVPVGTTPRDALVIALAERGYQVVR